MENGDELINDDVEATWEAAASCTGTACPLPTLMRSKIKFGFDQTMKARMASDSTTFGAWISSVMTHVTTFFSDNSLTSTVQFEIDPNFLETPQSWTSENNIGNAREEYIRLIGNLNNDIDLVAWFADDSQEFGVVGVAYVGAVCSYSYKQSLNEHRSTIVASAEVLAHEIGHNFGMSHDFDAKNSGQGCTGLMDYGNPPQTWSTCSVNDFKTFFNTNNWGNGCFEGTWLTKTLKG